jgi:hypothetical protein
VELPITITLPNEHNNNNNNNNQQQIVYELPVTEEEYLSKYILECDNIFRSEGNQLDLIQMQLLTTRLILAKSWRFMVRDLTTTMELCCREDLLILEVVQTIQIIFIT